MEKEYQYYIVSADMLPDAMLKTAEAKSLLRSKAAKNVSEAVKLAGISRSVYYKYKDAIRPYYEKDTDKLLTIYALLHDKPGVLSVFLSVLAEEGANILTINQNIPVNGFAPVTVSVRVGRLKTMLSGLLKELSQLDGVADVDILGKE